EAVEKLLTRLEPDDRVVLLRDDHGSGHDPDSLAVEVGQGADALDIAGNNQPELGTGVRNAPGHRALRPGVDWLAGDHIATTFRQTVPGARGAGAPVELDRPAQHAAHAVDHGHVQALWLSVRSLAGPRHGGRHNADGECPRGRIRRPRVVLLIAAQT